FRKALEISPSRTLSHALLSTVFLEQERREEALREAEREPAGPMRLWALTLVYHAMGRAVESQRCLDQLIEYGVEASSQIGEVYAARGDKSAAFEWLDRAIQHHDATEMKPERLLRSLHSDPRWGALLKKMGLEEAPQV